MPIRPENRARYPADWPRIRRQVREAAGNRCGGSPAIFHLSPSQAARLGRHLLKAAGVDVVRRVAR